VARAVSAWALVVAPLVIGCAEKGDTGRPPASVEVRTTFVRGAAWVYEPSVVPLGEASLVVSDPLDGVGGVVRLFPFAADPWDEPEVTLVSSADFTISALGLQSAQGRLLAGTLGLEGAVGSLVADEQIEGLESRRVSVYRALDGAATPTSADAWWDFSEYRAIVTPGDLVGLDGDGDGADELWTSYSGLNPSVFGWLCPFDPGLVGAQPEPVEADCLIACLNPSLVRSSGLDVDGDGRQELAAVCEGHDGVAAVLFFDGASPGGSPIGDVTRSSVVGVARDGDWWGDHGATPQLGVAAGSDGVYLSSHHLDPEEPCVGWVTEVPSSGAVEAREGAEACAPTGEAGTIDLGGSGAAAHVLLASGTTLWSAPLDEFSGDWTELVDVGEPVVGLRAARGDRVAAILGDGLALIWYDGVRGE
jgi:hypothetical protein